MKINVAPPQPAICPRPVRVESAEANPAETFSPGVVVDSKGWTGYDSQAAVDKFASKLDVTCGPAVQGAARGALIGILAGATPALTIIGIPLCAVTIPMGAVLGAFAGAVAAHNPNYTQEAPAEQKPVLIGHADGPFPLDGNSTTIEVPVDWGKGSPAKRPDTLVEIGHADGPFPLGGESTTINVPVDWSKGTSAKQPDRVVEIGHADGPFPLGGQSTTINVPVDWSKGASAKQPDKVVEIGHADGPFRVGSGPTDIVVKLDEPIKK